MISSSTARIKNIWSSLSYGSFYFDSSVKEAIAVCKNSRPYKLVKLSLQKLKITTKFNLGEFSKSSANTAKFYLSLSDGLGRYFIISTQRETLVFAISWLYRSTQIYKGKFGSFRPGESIKIVLSRAKSAVFIY